MQYIINDVEEHVLPPLEAEQHPTVPVTRASIHLSDGAEFYLTQEDDCHPLWFRMSFGDGDTESLLFDPSEMKELARFLLASAEQITARNS
ncbi:hypothetical protein [Pyruvatibacter mobilis]|uniref:hypothetical protein n=1 Tax=Pyruvatibacter mobilis TaxID=1712261 RepID=UPI003BABBCBC